MKLNNQQLSKIQDELLKIETRLRSSLKPKPLNKDLDSVNTTQSENIVLAASDPVSAPPDYNKPV